MSRQAFSRLCLCILSRLGEVCVIGDLEEEDIDIAVGHDFASVAAAIALRASSRHDIYGGMLRVSIVERARYCCYQVVGARGRP